jgi:hypothetical protein
MYPTSLLEVANGRKWFLAEIGHVGLNNLLAAYSDKSANAICTFAYCEGPGADVKLFEGICEVNPCTYGLGLRFCALPFSLGADWEGRYCPCSGSE